MKTKFRAALASLLLTAVAAGAAMMPSTASAHAETGPLCWGNEPGGVWMWKHWQGVPYFVHLAYGEPFRIKYTLTMSENFVSFGHSAGSNQVDYYVETSWLRCDRPPF